MSAPEPMPVICPYCLTEQGVPRPERASDVTCARHIPAMRAAWGLPPQPSKVTP